MTADLATVRPKLRSSEAEGDDGGVLAQSCNYVQITARAPRPIKTRVVALSEPVVEVLMCGAGITPCLPTAPLAMVILSGEWTEPHVAGAPMT